MKKISRLSSVVFLMIFTSQIHSQVKFGVKTGLNLATMLDKDSSTIYSKEYKKKPSLLLGVTGEFPFSDNFSIESGLLFSSKGYKMKDSSATVSVNLSYFEIPINAVYNFDLDYIKMTIKAGPYIGAAVKGKAKSNEKVFTDGQGNSVNKVDLNLGRNKTDFAKQLDYGISFGLGAEVNSICFGIQYGLGLANITTNTENENIFKNRVIGITIGYKFTAPEQTETDGKSNKKYSKKRKSRGKLKRY